MRSSEKVLYKVIFVLTCLLVSILPARSSDIVDITPVTNKILLVVFDDGTVVYPSDLQVDRLAIDAATDVVSYTITSDTDAEYSPALHPVDIGRKSKGTEFVKDAPWGGNSFDPRSKPWASKHFIYLFLENELKSGNTYVLQTGNLAANGSEWSFTFDEKELRSESVHVNTIGYETNAPKLGYVYQWMGDRGGLDLTAYNGKSFYVYKDGVVDPVFSGVLKKRKSATNAETGQPNDTPDRNFLGAEVYECEFTSITDNGIYELVVEGMGCSFPFKIGNDALWNAYYTVGRALYHQRSGIRLAPPYTEEGYIRPVNQNTKVTSDDGADFSGQLLYSDFPYTSWQNGDGGGSSQAAIRDAAEGNVLDVVGWYHDAGDWDGYFSHQRIPPLLMLTYEFFPERFADGDLNLPECGNGIPDIVDEASWLIKFNYRLRKELMDKGYSDGGVGGARVCPDVYNEVEGNAQSNKPSWQDYRHYVVTQADPFMTYLYAGQAAQFALILEKLGKDPHAFPVEMLDHVDLQSMTRDTVDWEKEAIEAYAWASAPGNQPESNNNFGGPLGIYRMYAAASLYRLTNEPIYHDAALLELEEIRNKTRLAEDERYGVYTYLLADNYSKDRILEKDLVDVAAGNAEFNGMVAAEQRACRYGGVFDMPMLVGQATTPKIFEVMMAYGITGEKEYLDVAHTTADYFLGCNPLHTTWVTHLGPRPAEVGFHLDSRYNNDWVVYPGFIPYGPWSMSYGYDPYTWTIDGVEYEGGHGPWNKDWANFSQYPFMEEWPGHERWNSNIHAPLSSENTVHQNAVYGLLTYGFVNNRHNENATSAKPVTALNINKPETTLSKPGSIDTLKVTIDPEDATFPALAWTSSDSRIAHVDEMGRVTGVTSGTCTITCSTLDGSVEASCNVICDWEEIAVDSISVEPDSLSLVEGQTAYLDVFFYPDSATNNFIDWSYSVEGIVSVDENGILHAIAPGEVHVIATSLNSSRRDTCSVTVIAAYDYIVADFDSVVPVLSSPMPEVAQLYTPGGSSDIAAANPLKVASNNSEKVVQYNKPAGDYKLIGIVLPTDHPQDLDKFSQFRFKYFGDGIEAFYIQLKDTTGETGNEFTAPVAGENAWKLFAYDLDVNYALKQFNVFVNPTGNMPAMTCFFDDFILSGKTAEYFEGLTISDQSLEMSSGDEYVIVAESDGHPFSWISMDSTIAMVDQYGKVTAVSKGTVALKAVPLYGDIRECTVYVDGGTYIEPTTYETSMILDFEAYELDWSAGYGGYAWSTDTWSKIANPESSDINNSENVFSWERGAAFVGGFGIAFPPKSTRDWSRLSMMVYSTGETGSVQFEFFRDTSLLGKTQAEITVPANRWTQLVFDLADLDMVNREITKIQFMFGVGTQDIYTVYLDNVWLERGTDIPVTGTFLDTIAPVTLEKGNVLQLDATVSPVNASEPGISWESSVPTVASVNEAGLVTALDRGTTVISAASVSDPEVSAELEITVEDHSFTEVTSVTIEGDTLYLKVDSVVQLTVNIEPPDATDKTVSWKSEDTGIAFINDAGLVTGTAIGTTSIIATSVSNPDVCDSIMFVVGTSGIVESGFIPVVIYPNPFDNFIEVRSGLPVSRIRLADITGETIYNIDAGGRMELTLDELKLSVGMYFLVVEMQDGRIATFRVISGR
ncbi:MAG: Ig-like domain-containing protein [Bacteroidales bacterium]|nr:Ig-like domain-containing protein [Bacteroidales bacterium]